MKHRRVRNLPWGNRSTTLVGKIEKESRARNGGAAPVEATL